MKLIVKLFICFHLLLGQSFATETFKPFGFSSRQELEKVYAGRPFILAFWSIDCVYCIDELNILSNLIKQHPKIRLVLVNTDGQSASVEVRQALKKVYLPAQYELWQFAETDEERLRYLIDKKWCWRASKNLLL